MTDYLPFGLFLAAALAGAAFFVDEVLAAGLVAALLGAGFFAAVFAPLAAASFSGAGFSVGVPATSPDFCWVS
jgi:hypothetical protein